MSSTKYAIAISSALGVLAGVLVPLDCSPAGRAVARDVTVKVAYDACSELLDASTDLPGDWVALLCQAGADQIKVLLPRAEWHSIRAAKLGVDAGPGK